MTRRLDYLAQAPDLFKKYAEFGMLAGKGVEPTITDRDFVIASIKTSSAAIAAAHDEEVIAEEQAAAAEAAADEVPATEQSDGEAAEGEETTEA